MPKDEGRFRLNSGFRSDLLWWVTFLDSWNGWQRDTAGGESSHMDRCIWELMAVELGTGVRRMDPVGVESSG